MKNCPVGKADLVWMVRKSFPREAAFKLKSKEVGSNLMKRVGISIPSRVNSTCKGSEAGGSMGN